MKKSARKTNDRKSSSAKRHSGQPQQQQFAASGAGKQYGEGSYSGTRQYNKGLKEHMQSHDIEREARDAAPRSTDEAKQMARRLAREEGLFAGTSSGANVIAALRVAERLGPEARVVTLLCDSGLKYVNTDVYRID